MAHRPDFERLRKALLCEGTETVPPIELLVDRDVKEAFLGKPVADLQTEVEFWVEAGYDYIPIYGGILGPAAIPSEKAAQIGRGKYSLYRSEEQEKMWAIEGEGLITNLQELQEFPWPDPKAMDYSAFEEARKHLPDGMKVIGVLGKIFTATWMLMGFETFCFALAEDTELVAKMFERVGSIQFDVFKKMMTMENIGAMWMPDDVAYAEGLMVSPEVLRRYVFPWYKRMGEICRDQDMPFIYHSDGKLWEVLDDIIDCGFCALHPIEPKAMDAKKLKGRVKGKLCLLGNIDLDRLSRGQPDEIRELTKQKIDELGRGGGYCAGSSNSVTDYIPLMNYKSMLDVILHYK